MEGACQSGKTGNESLIISHITEERLNLLLGGGAGPAKDGLYLDLLRSDVPASDSVALVGGLLLAKMALGWVGGETHLPQLP